MANYIGWILTNKGRELLAKAINNETKINVTKFKIGAGYNTGNDGAGNSAWLSNAKQFCKCK